MSVVAIVTAVRNGRSQQPDRCLAPIPEKSERQTTMTKLERLPALVAVAWITSIGLYGAAV